MGKIWKWIDHNRFIVIGPIVAIAIWAYAVGCTPQTRSPLDPKRLVTERELGLDLKSWQAENEIMIAKFEAAGEDLEEQRQNNKKLEDFIVAIASGNVADLPGLITLLITGGGLGAITDNIRKRGLISGLKRNKID